MEDNVSIGAIESGSSDDMDFEQLADLTSEVRSADPETIEEELRAGYTNAIQETIAQFEDQSETVSPFTTDIGGPGGLAVEKVHENRSERAQTVDEKQNAPVTTDEEKWVENKNRYDYPGVDTIPPERLAARSESAAEVAQEKGFADRVEQQGSAKNLQGKFSPRGSTTYGKGEHVVRVQETANQPERTLAHEIGHAADFGFGDSRGYNLTDELFDLGTPTSEGETEDLVDEAKEVSQKARGDFQGQEQYRRQFKELTADILGQAIVQPRATKRDAPILFNRLEEAAQEEGFGEMIPDPLAADPDRPGILDLE